MSGSEEEPRTLWVLEADDDAASAGSFGDGTLGWFSACGPLHPCNEDGALAMELHDGVVLAVADGMGGLPDGQTAARLALEALSARVRARGADEDLTEATVAGFEAAHASVTERGRGSGTTLVVGIVQRGVLTPVHVGDSDLLVAIRDGGVRMRTIAHSPTGLAFGAGELEELEAMLHEERHFVSNVLGQGPMTVDIGEPVTLQPGDTIVLASDGLFDNLTGGDVARQVSTGPLADALAALASTTIERMATGDGVEVPGKPDDLTVLAFRADVTPEEVTDESSH